MPRIGLYLSVASRVPGRGAARDCALDCASSAILRYLALRSSSGLIVLASKSYLGFLVLASGFACSGAARSFAGSNARSSARLRIGISFGLLSVSPSSVSLLNVRPSRAASTASSTSLPSLAASIAAIISSSGLCPARSMLRSATAPPSRPFRLMALSSVSALVTGASSLGLRSSFSSALNFSMASGVQDTGLRAANFWTCLSHLKSRGAGLGR